MQLGHIPNFSPGDLAVLVAVADAGSSREAASALGRTPAAVSYAIGRLERDAGFPILARPSYRTQFTRRGEALASRARSVLHELEALGSLAAVLASGVEPRWVLVVDRAISQSIWSSLAKAIAHSYPNTELEVRGADGNDAFQLLASGYAQAAIVMDYACGDPVSGFEYQRMGKVEFVEVVSNRQSVDPAGANLPEIVIGGDFPHDRPYHAANRVKVSDRSVQLGLVLDGLGWGRLPKELVASHIGQGDLMVMPNSRTVDYSFSICRKSDAMGPVADLVWLCAGLPIAQVPM